MKSKLIIPAALLLAAALIATLGAPALASNQIAQETGITCTECHDKPGSRRLTDKGLYFEATRTLEGYQQLTDFAECTSCHVRKPGSKKLTETGKRFAAAVKDMNGLRRWVEENHPLMQSH